MWLKPYSRHLQRGLPAPVKLPNHSDRSMVKCSRFVSDVLTLFIGVLHRRYATTATLLSPWSWPYTISAYHPALLRWLVPSHLPICTTAKSVPPKWLAAITLTLTLVKSRPSTIFSASHFSQQAADLSAWTLLILSSSISVDTFGCRWRVLNWLFKGLYCEPFSSLANSVELPDAGTLLASPRFAEVISRTKYLPAPIYGSG
jgi:predicted membrane protein